MTNAWVTGNLFGRLKLIGTYMKADGSNETRLRRGGRREFRLLRDLALLRGPRRNRELAGADGLLARIRPSRVRRDVQCAGRRRLVRRTAARSPGQALIASLFLNTVTFAGVPAGDLLQPDRRADGRRAPGHRLRRRRDGADARALFGQRRLVAAPAGRPRDPRCLRDHRAGRPGRRIRAHGQHLRRRLHVRGVRRDPDGRLPARRRQPADLPERLHQPGPLQVPGHSGTSRTSSRSGRSSPETHADDDIVEIGYRAKVREFVADVEVSLLKNMLTVRASGGEFATNREILIRVPQDFEIIPTKQKEFGHTWEGGVHFRWKDFSMDAAYLWMNNNGSIPFTVDRFRVVADYFFLKNLGATFEWLDDKYREASGVRPGRRARGLQRKPLLRRFALASLKPLGDRIPPSNRRFPMSKSGFSPRHHDRGARLGRLDRLYRSVVRRHRDPEAGEGRRRRREELPVLSHRRAAEEGCLTTSTTRASGWSPRKTSAAPRKSTARG